LLRKVRQKAAIKVVKTFRKRSTSFFKWEAMIFLLLESHNGTEKISLKLKIRKVKSLIRVKPISPIKMILKMTMILKNIPTTKKVKMKPSRKRKRKARIQNKIK
jgi:hypothetical protein